MNISVDIHPFSVPEFVTLKMPVRPRQEGYKPQALYPLSDMDAQTLSDMCDEFRKQIFKNAGKKDPKREAG